MYQTAELTSLLRTIAIIVMVYYGYKFISRYLFPILMSWAAKKAQQKLQDQMNQQFGGVYNHQKRREDNRTEGEVKIDHTDQKKKPTNDSDLGEYVDFEEIE